MIAKSHIHFHLDSLRIPIELAAFLSLGSTRLGNQESHKHCVFLYVIGQNLNVGLGAQALESSGTKLKSPCHRCLTKRLHCSVSYFLYV